MGLYLKKELKNGATIGVWKIDETEEELLNLLGEAKGELEKELENIKLYKSQQHRKEQLSVILLVNEIFGKIMHIGHHDNGSPYLENDSTKISITHTTGFSAIIIDPSQDVGIDIESIKRDFSSVEKKALSPEEIDDLIEVDIEDKEQMQERNVQLAIYWCAKEAIYKRMGRNLVEFAEDIELEKFTVKEEGEVYAVFKYPKEEQVQDEDGEDLNELEEFELEYEIFEDHILVWLVG